MLVAILLFTAALVAAQQPKPCTTPTQWEGRFVRSDFDKKFFQRAGITYDETQKRVREIEEVEIDTEREYYDVLYLHNINKEYRLNLRTRKCNTTALTRPWMPFGIPNDARYEGEAVIGPANINGEHVTVARFDGRVPEGGFFYGSVSYPDCVPISSGFFTNRTGFVHTTFFDVTIGIPDPSVFNPPSECTP